jgi:N utilization substance protein B
MTITKINSPKVNPHKRRKARRLALQAIYQWQIARQSLTEIALQYNEDENMPKSDGAYFHELLQNIPPHCEALDAEFLPFLDRPAAELDPIELAILRMGAYELITRLEIPYRVVINEAVELAKLFGAEDGYKYVNGILNQLARKVRGVEVSA